MFRLTQDQEVNSFVLSVRSRYWLRRRRVSIQTDRKGLTLRFSREPLSRGSSNLFRRYTCSTLFRNIHPWIVYIRIPSNSPESYKVLTAHLLHRLSPCEPLPSVLDSGHTSGPVQNYQEYKIRLLECQRRVPSPSVPSENLLPHLSSPDTSHLVTPTLSLLPILHRPSVKSSSHRLTFGNLYRSSLYRHQT